MREYHQWTKEENEQLVQIVNQFTVNNKINWDSVKVYYPTRTVTSIKSQYLNKLKLGTESYHKWTPEEQELLKQCVQTLGKNWTKIQQLHFPEVSPNSLHTKYFTIMNKENKSLSKTASQIYPSQNSIQHSQLSQQFYSDISLKRSLDSSAEADRTLVVDHVYEIGKKYIQKEIFDMYANEMVGILANMLPK
ncbi:Conserved_hypothetical protein [Hexamita inflata]|uniref:Myb-like DNA-binding domain-containing protein n=1 Tax=Hexamita inflata TaxID=28002 RepID=A0ABP1GJK9_9EUKA